MILILISWIYIFLITSTVAITVSSILKIKNIDPVINLFLGFFYITLFTGFWAIFYRVNWEFHVVLFIFSALSFFIKRENIILFYRELKTDFINLSTLLKVIFLIISILTLIKSAAAPILVDNESYYIQTIKWLNEYGFVKGLVNLHPFLGQTSGWHILQSAFSFSFIYEKFNDINGFSFIFANLFFLKKLNLYFNGDNKIENLIIGLFPLSNLFFFQFLSSPSPDIPVYIISFFIFYLLFKLYKNFTNNDFYTITVLTLFVILIKLTSIILIIIPLIIIAKNYKNSNNSLIKLVPLGAIPLLLFLVKNYIITGNILYPTNLFNSFDASWSPTATMKDFYYNHTKMIGFFMTPSDYQKSGYLDLFIHWINLYGRYGFFNKAIIITLVVFPFVIKNTINRTVIVYIYTISIVNMILFFYTSPQYRFSYQFLLILSIIVLITITKNKKIILSLLVFSTITVSVPIFLPLNIPFFKKDILFVSKPKFSSNPIIFPYKNSKHELTYEIMNLDNFKFYSPKEDLFLWDTGDMPLPALNKKLYYWFKENYYIIPQMRTDNLKDGFYSKQIE